MPSQQNFYKHKKKKNEAAIKLKFPSKQRGLLSNDKVIKSPLFIVAASHEYRENKLDQPVSEDKC
jgi:succinate dehydrogenase flavin-adding protein (antitoxin of CptAB toxin-antitoxin module)